MCSLSIRSGTNVWCHRQECDETASLFKSVHLRGCCVLTLTVWAVITSLHCPRHLLQKAIKVSLTLTLMWPSAPIASPVPTQAQRCRSRAHQLCISVAEWLTDWHTWINPHPSIPYPNSKPHFWEGGLLVCLPVEWWDSRNNNTKFHKH